MQDPAGVSYEQRTVDRTLSTRPSAPSGSAESGGFQDSGTSLERTRSTKIVYEGG